MSNAGQIKSDGASALPDGIRDLAAGGSLLDLGEEAESRLKKMMEGLIGPDEVKARYKLEVVFGNDRSLHHPFRGLVQAWVNGGYAHGGGDEALYFCPNEVEKNGQKRYCGEPIQLAFINKQFALCPGCKRRLDPKELAGQVFYNTTVQGWVDVLVRAFARLECNADIRIGYFKGDIQRAAKAEQEREHRGEKLHAATSQRVWCTYSLRNIVSDTSHGSTLQSRLRAFLLA